TLVTFVCTEYGRSVTKEGIIHQVGDRETSRDDNSHCPFVIRQLLHCKEWNCSSKPRSSLPSKERGEQLPSLVPSREEYLPCHDNAIPAILSSHLLSHALDCLETKSVALQSAMLDLMPDDHAIQSSGRSVVFVEKGHSQM